MIVSESTTQMETENKACKPKPNLLKDIFSDFILVEKRESDVTNIPIR
jgi:hypothetical protein